MPPAFNATPDLPDGAYEKPSQFSDVDALWVDGIEIAHVEAQDATGVAYDVRLTRQVIRDRRAALRTDPRVTLRPSTSADWLTLRVCAPEDRTLLKELLRLAALHNRRTSQTVVVTG